MILKGITARMSRFAMTKINFGGEPFWMKYGNDKWQVQSHQISPETYKSSIFQLSSLLKNHERKYTNKGSHLN